MTVAESARPIPAIALRAQVPAEYLRLLSDWADSVAAFKDATGDPTAARKAHWMSAALSPTSEMEEGR